MFVKILVGQLKNREILEEIDMPNMSYCRFENTVNDMYDCQQAIEEAVMEGKTPSEFMEEMSDYEKSAFDSMLQSCKDMIAVLEDLGVVA